MKIDNRSVAVVVGGASGLGEATVRALRDADAAVSVLDLDAERGERIAAETGAVFFAVDVTDEGSVQAAFAKARSRQGQERILVHTAAIGAFALTAGRNAETGAIERHPFALFERIVRVNLSGSLLCASVSAAGMMTLDPLADGERGAIVLTSSIVAEDVKPGLSAYAASKAAVDALARTMARDLGPECIRVNSILPGSFTTPMNAGVPDAFKTEMLGWITHPKRFGAPCEYASLVLEMVRNGYLNGVAVRIDGGCH